MKTVSRLEKAMIADFELQLEMGWHRKANFHDGDKQKDFIMDLAVVKCLALNVPDGAYDALADYLLAIPEVLKTFEWMEKTRKEHYNANDGARHLS